MKLYEHIFALKRPFHAQLQYSTAKMKFQYGFSQKWFPCEVIVKFAAFPYKIVAIIFHKLFDFGFAYR